MPAWKRPQVPPTHPVNFTRRIACDLSEGVGRDSTCIVVVDDSVTCPPSSTSFITSREDRGDASRSGRLVMILPQTFWSVQPLWLMSSRRLDGRHVFQAQLGDGLLSEDMLPHLARDSLGEE